MPTTYPNATHISPHYTWAEFKVNPATMKPDDKRRMIAHCTLTLEPISAHYGRPVNITPEGGYRSYEEQAALYAADLHRNGGKPSGLVAKPGSSRHNFGDGSDIWIKGVPHHELAAYAATLPHVGGVGLYSWGVHVDSRPVGSPGRPTSAVARWHE